MPGKKKPQVRVSISLPDGTASGLDREVKKIRKKNPGTHPTRSSVAASLVRSGILRKADTKEERREAYKLIVREAAALKIRAKMAVESGDYPASRSYLLQAAAAELDALSVSGLNDEAAIRSAIIEVLSLLKSSTGYKHLPEVSARIDAPARDS